jgi:diguanylate cyclase (GGDEF)-like protein
MAATGGVIGYEARELVRDRASLNEVFHALSASGRVMDSLREAEIAKRGYLLTGDQAYLAPYRKAMGDVDAACQTLARVAAGDRASDAGIGRVRTDRDLAFDDMRRVLDVSRAGDSVAPTTAVELDHGKRRVDAAQADIGRLQAAWLSRRDALRQDSAWRFRSIAASLGISAALVSALIACIVLFDRQSAAGSDRRVARLNDEMTEDPLTGLLNRRRLLEEVDRIAAIAHAGNSRIAVLYMDVDGFKAVNDKFGHDAGDTLLKRIGTALRTVVRARDLLARVGGDEFVVLLSDYDTDRRLQDIAVRLIAQVREVGELEFQGQLSIGLSVGIATFPKMARSVHDLINLADGAMYDAKQGGRGRYRFGEPREYPEDAADASCGPASVSEA